MSHHHASNIQAILFDRDYWSIRQAKNWMKKHNYPSDNYRETSRKIRFRLLDPKTYSKYRIKKIGEEIEFVLGYHE